VHKAVNIQTKTEMMKTLTLMIIIMIIILI